MTYNFDAEPEDVRDWLTAVAAESDHFGDRLIEGIMDLLLDDKIKVDISKPLDEYDGELFIKFLTVTASELVDNIFANCWADEVWMEEGDILRLWWD